MILTEQPILVRTSKFRKESWGRRSDDIRRSIDVLDQVLSEFDDIEPLYDDEEGKANTPEPSEVQEVPPPIDRSLKPKSVPPTLPQKTRKKSTNEGPEKEGLGSVGTPVSPQSPHNSLPELALNGTNTQRSHQSFLSGVSSHEYQEINSDICFSPTRRRNSANDGDKVQAHPQKQRRRSTREHVSSRIPGEGDPSRMSLKKGVEHPGGPLRKSRSGDVSLTAEDVQLGRGRKSSRKQSHHHQRRGRSSDRYFDHHQQRFAPPRRQSDAGHRDPRIIDTHFTDPRMIDSRLHDPRLIDPRNFDPRFMNHKPTNQRIDPRFIDPKFMDMNHCDPRLMEPPFFDPTIFMDDPFMVPIDGPRGRHPLDEPVPFPHLMVSPLGVPGPYSLPPTSSMDFHPHTIPPYDYRPMQDHLLSPDHIMPDIPFHPMDPHFEGFNPHMNGYDPALPHLPPHPHMLPHNAYPGVEPPMDLPFDCPPDFVPPVKFTPRERLSYDGGGGRGYPYSKEFCLPGERGWLPPTSEEARKMIQGLVRNPNHRTCEDELRREDDNLSDPRMTSKVPGRENIQLKSAGSSDSSGRSSPLENVMIRQGEQRNKTSSKGQKIDSRRNSASRPAGFRVGEAVRRDEETHREFGGKDTVSLPHFVSGGKDSGFDESPVVDEASLKSPGSSHGTSPGGVGGGFVVAGVFSDSSKMYIPAPPSPTPDYDHEQGASDGEDFDIPQEPFYVSSKPKKSSSGSNRDSLSEDSLQGGKPGNQKHTKIPSNPPREGNSLQALMAEFHSGLPPPSREEGRFSDDSLEEEEETEESSSIASPPTRNQASKMQAQRPESMESLISMDGSTTSFDYMSDLHQQQKSSSVDHIRRGSNEVLSKAGPNGLSQHSQNKQKTSPKIRKSGKISPKENGGRQVEKKSRGSSSSSMASSSRNDSFSESPPPREQSHGSGSSCNTPAACSTPATEVVPKFDTIKHLIKEGLIQGLDETPPDFAPPPPPKMIRSASINEERADSGLGSTASTHRRVDESGSSDSRSDRLSTTPPEKNFQNHLSRESLQRRTSSPPPLPPPRDSSMTSRSVASTDTPSQPSLVRNQSWLYKNKKGDKIPSQKSNPAPNPRDTKANLDNARRVTNDRKDKNRPNKNISCQYATPLDNWENELNMNTYHENMKNLHVNHMKKILNESCSLASDDQVSVSSHGSRSGRFFSRLTESMKSGSRTNSPIVNKHGKDNKSKKAAPKYHGDFIRVPSKVKGEAPKPPLGGRPPEFRNISDPSSVLPLSRDGSGRFRSIEDLAEVSGKSLELKRSEDDQRKKSKKNSTLPPNLTPADMMTQEKEYKRSNSTSQGSKNKDESDGSKFKFNIFKGLWRRNKYSFDKV